MPPKKKDNVRDWFTKEMSTKDRIKARKVLVPIPGPVEDFDSLPCDECASTGECEKCGGDGTVEHDCSCELCEIWDEECWECDGSGECKECEGTGAMSIYKPDNDPTKY